MAKGKKTEDLEPTTTNGSPLITACHISFFLEALTEEFHTRGSN